MRTLEASSACDARSQQVAGQRVQLPSLTQLRWVAALLVFLYHARNLGLFGAVADKRANWAFGAGSTGVSLFFILSGFVIAWSARPGDRAGAFWLRRFARIYPLHLLTALIALLLAVAAVPGLQIPGRREAVANLLLVSAWHHDWWQALNPVSWSLTCEAFFYATFPIAYAVMRRLGRRGLEATIVIAVAAVVILAWLTHHDALPVSLYEFPPTRLPEFLAGVAAALLVQRGQWRGPATAPAAVITTVGYFLTAQMPGPYRAVACTMIGFTLLIPALATADRQRRPIAGKTTIGERLGEISYAFYLIHLLVLHCVTAVAGQNLPVNLGQAMLWTAPTLLVSVALAWLLHTYVEVPARHLLLRHRPGGSDVRRQTITSLSAALALGLAFAVMVHPLGAPGSKPTPTPPRCTVIMGASIATGYLAAPGASWPALARQQLAAGDPDTCLHDRSIGATRLLLSQPDLPSYLDREAAALDVPYVADIVLTDLINDIQALPHQYDPQVIIAGIRRFVAAAHDRDVRVVATTITPYGGYRYTPEQSYAAAGERCRQEVNAALRQGGLVDGIIDFDQALADPNDTTRLGPEYDSGDHLHPSTGGHQAMADVAAAALREPGDPARDESVSSWRWYSGAGHVAKVRSPGASRLR